MTQPKRQWQWERRSLIGLSVFALCISVFFARSASLSPDVGRVAVPVSLTFLTVSLISWAVSQIVKELVARIRSLEVRIEKLEAESDFVL